MKTSKKIQSETVYSIHPDLQVDIHGKRSEAVAIKETWYPADEAEGYPAEYQYELRGYELFKNGKRVANSGRISLGYDPDGLKIEEICKDYGIEVKVAAQL
jgi:hypothetical protein